MHTFSSTMVYITCYLSLFLTDTQNTKTTTLRIDLCAVIIALKASGRDCTNNNELFHKIGVSQRYAMQLFVFTSEILQAIRWRSKYNGCTQGI